MTKGRLGTVPGYKTNLVTEWKELLLNRVDQSLMIALWEIGSTYRAWKQHIADRGHRMFSVDKDYMTWRVPWTMHHIQTKVADLNLFTIFKPTIRQETFDLRESKHRALLLQSI